MPDFYRTIDNVVATLKSVQRRGKGCAVLIGAGCSVKAGVPLAREFVKIIERDHPWEYSRAGEKTYPKCMAELSFDERRDLIAQHVDQAKINWAHLAIAQLMQGGYIDRVLTTNFDPLAVRACALLNEFPAVYDFAASDAFRPEDIPDKAVFYLHGQRSGFVLLNTEEECRRQAERVCPVFDDAGRARVWIVVGYSGENDPVFEILAQVPRFNNRLYWVGYKDDEPAAHVRERLLVPGKDAYFVKGYDADDFFVTLAQRLNCFPPTFITDPFAHLNAVLEMTTPYTLPGQDTDVDVAEPLRRRIRAAIEREQGLVRSVEQELSPAETAAPPSASQDAQRLLMAGDYEAVVALRPGDGQAIPLDLVDPLSSAYFAQGNALSKQAMRTAGAAADELFGQAFQKYEAALQVKPDMHDALNNWGAALYDQALTKQGEEADRLFVLAGEKYRAALQIMPNKHEVFNNWGSALSDQALTKQGEEADRLFALAGEKYGAALQIMPDKYQALSNWALTLMDQADTKTGAEAARLFAEAAGKLLSAESIWPGSGAYNLACLSALQDREEECRQWLEKCREFRSLPSREYLESDKDLNRIREREWFQKFLEEA